MKTHTFPVAREGKIGMQVPPRCIPGGPYQDKTTGRNRQVGQTPTPRFGHVIGQENPVQAVGLRSCVMKLNPIAGLVGLVGDSGAIQRHDFVQHQRALIPESNPHGIARPNALILSHIQCPHLHTALLNR